jgi:flagellar basal-body rod protein FlgC
MSLFNAIDVAATALDAQSVRMNTISSNLANANAVSGSEQETYRAQFPVFETLYRDLAAGGAVSVSACRASCSPSCPRCASTSPRTPLPITTASSTGRR